MIRLFQIVIFVVFISLMAIGQESLLQSGPMVGYSTMREVAVWVQTTQEAVVHIEYMQESDTSKVYQSDRVRTNKKSAYTAHLLLETEPGLTYTYRLFINGQHVTRPYPLTFTSQTLWHWRTDPPDFNFAIGSCMYSNEPQYDRPGEPYGKSPAIFTSIYENDPDFMVWLGDNIYLREVDWNSRSGILKRYTHMRATPEIQALMGSVHHYAIWDDHDYGPNDSDRSYWGKKMTEEAFKMFWANPNYDVVGNGGITGTFFWNDCQFFMLDNRYHRTPDDGEQRMILGEAQLEWLFDALKYSQASFKFICTGGQFLSDAAIYENHARFPEERQAIIDFLDKHNMHGVVFLNGDRHSSEVSKLVTDDGDVFYDITCSALTSKTYDHLKEPNNNRIEGTMIGQNNYAILNVKGKRKSRQLSVTFRDVKGDDIIDELMLSFPPRKK